MGRVASLRKLFKQINACDLQCLDSMCCEQCAVLCEGGEFKVDGYVYRAVGSEHDDRLLAMNDKVFEFKELLVAHSGKERP